MKYIGIFLLSLLSLIALNIVIGGLVGYLGYIIFIHSREAEELFWKAIIVFSAGSLLLASLHSLLISLERHRTDTRGKDAPPGTLESVLRYFVFTKRAPEIQE